MNNSASKRLNALETAADVLARRRRRTSVDLSALTTEELLRYEHLASKIRKRPDGTCDLDGLETDELRELRDITKKAQVK